MSFVVAYFCKCVTWQRVISGCRLTAENSKWIRTEKVWEPGLHTKIPTQLKSLSLPKSCWCMKANLKTKTGCQSDFQISWMGPRVTVHFLTIYMMHIIIDTATWFNMLLVSLIPVFVMGPILSHLVFCFLFQWNNTAPRSDHGLCYEHIDMV